MEEALNIIFYLFIVFMPFLNGLYFEKDFILASFILLILVMIEKLYLTYKKKIDLRKVFPKKILHMYLGLFLINLSTYYIGQVFYNLPINYEALVYGSLQILEMEMISTLCILKINEFIDKKEKEKRINYQNISVMVSSLLMGLLLFFKEFYRNGRFEGTFYYANSTAMFFLISLALAINFKTKNKKLLIVKVATILFDLSAIILTNSRFTYLLLVFYLMIELVRIIVRKYKNKKDNDKDFIKKIFSSKNIIIGIIIFLLIILSSCIVLSNDKIKNRFETSTITRDINLRLSYLDEANDIIKDYPFGLGYEGYLNHQEIKENKYKLRLVHNMPYQIVLNYGVIMLVFTLIYFYMYIKKCIDNKKLINTENIILLLLLLHSLIDIGTSFLAIDNIVIMLITRNLYKEE